MHKCVQKNKIRNSHLITLRDAACSNAQVTGFVRQIARTFDTLAGLLKATIDEATLPVPYIKEPILFGFSLDQSVRCQPNEFFTKRGEHGIWDLSAPKDLKQIVTLASVGMDVSQWKLKGIHQSS